MKRSTMVVSALVTTVVGLGLTSPAHAAVGVQLINVRYTECLAASGTASGSAVTHVSCNTSDNAQRWIGESLGSYTIGGTPYNTYRFRNVATNMCIDVTNNGTASGTPLVLHGCNGLDQQRFAQALSSSSNSYNFANIWATVKSGVVRVIDTPPASQSTSVRLWSNNSTDAQQFYVVA